MLTTTCPKCRTELRAQDQYAGRPVQCPQCGTICRLPTRTPATPAPSGPSPICSICRQPITEAADGLQDTQGQHYHRRCYEEACTRATQAAPRPVQLTADDTWTALDEAAARDATPSPLQPHAPTRRKGMPLGLWIALAMLIPVGMLVTMVVLTVLPSNPDEGPAVSGTEAAQTAETHGGPVASLPVDTLEARYHGAVHISRHCDTPVQ